MSIVDKLRDYYIKEHKDKIFSIKLTVENRKLHILYNYDKENEIKKFVCNFTEYLPYYVKNEDNLELIDLSNRDMSHVLKEVSKKSFNSSLIPQRNVRVNGLWGEVFLDFYERIVNDSKLFLTYVSRRSSDNNEIKGFDSFLFNIKDGDLEIIFAEAKFVSNKNNACSSLIEDIKGKECNKKNNGHLDIDYINEFCNLALEKYSFFSYDDKILIKDYVDNFNRRKINDNIDFCSYIKENKTCVHCVFFAIFSGNKFTPEEYINEYDKIEKEAKDKLNKIGFENYKIEIVFVPTKENSMNIKNAIQGFYNG